MLKVYHLLYAILRLTHVDGLVLKKDMYMVSCDVESLYMSINHAPGLRAVIFFLSTRNLDHDLVQHGQVLSWLRFIDNIFLFGRGHHRLTVFYHAP